MQNNLPDTLVARITDGVTAMLNQTNTTNAGTPERIANINALGGKEGLIRRIVNDPAIALIVEKANERGEIHPKHADRLIHYAGYNFGHDMALALAKGDARFDSAEKAKHVLYTFDTTRINVFHHRSEIERANNVLSGVSKSPSPFETRMAQFQLERNTEKLIEARKIAMDPFDPVSSDDEDALESPRP